MTDQRRRHSVYIDGFRHANPVPAASRVGQFVFSGGITGRDGRTDIMPADMAGQCANIFRSVSEIVLAAGGDVGDIVKMTFWLRDFRDRDALNSEWEALFPDPDDRPARHVISAVFDGQIRIQCDFIAVLDEAAVSAVHKTPSPVSQ